MPGQPIQVGPFIGGLNTFSDDTSIADNELVLAENWDLDLDGSLVSRPPFADFGIALSLAPTGNISLLGYYYAPDGTPYLIASDGATSTYYFNGTSWTLITSALSAAAMTQFDGKAWMTAPFGSTQNGGYWTPTGGFVADANMPRGDVLVAYKFRLFVAGGQGATSNGTRLYRSQPLGTTPFWLNSSSTVDAADIGAGDGQNIIQVVAYFNTLLIFRTRSVMSYQYSSDPAQAIISLIVPGVGLSSKDALVSFESLIYWMYDDRAYEFSNNRANQINQKVPFIAGNSAGIYLPFAVSEFNRRIIFSYYDVMYVFGLKTRTWTTWKSTAYGGIGKIVKRETGDEEVQAIAHSNQLVPSPTTRRNLFPDPRFLSGSPSYMTVAPNGGTGTTTVQNTGPSLAGGSPADLLGLWKTLRYQVTTVSTASPLAIRHTNTSGTAGLPVVGGSTYTVSAWLRCSNTSNIISGRLEITWYDAVGNSLGAVSPTNKEVGANTFTRLSYTVAAPTTAAFARVAAIFSNPEIVPVGGFFYLTGVLFEQSATLGEYFDGARADTAEMDYGWAGTANASASTATTKRAARTLQITDALTTDTEAMTCTLQTKNFNYEASSVYKRLFWWGIDATFRGTVQGWAEPVSYNYSVNWGALRTGGVTWGSLFKGGYTWSQPQTGTLSVYTERSTTGTSTSRKFIKFLKSLRFRQIHYRLSFDTDGSRTTAPVRVFSLMTYVKAKERVSKSIT